MIIMDDCPICKEEIRQTNICKTTCGHTYCLSCMIKHSKSNIVNKHYKIALEQSAILEN